SGSLPLGSLRWQARREAAREGLDVLMVDYLQLMSSGEREENRTNEMSRISRGLKLLARELDVPVVALSQLNRTVEARGNKRPLLSDLRDSGCLTGDSLISMTDGRRVPIRAVAVGDSVWALNTHSLKFEGAK